MHSESVSMDAIQKNALEFLVGLVGISNESQHAPIIMFLQGTHWQENSGQLTRLQMVFQSLSFPPSLHFAHSHCSHRMTSESPPHTHTHLNYELIEAGILI